MRAFPAYHVHCPCITPVPFGVVIVIVIIRTFGIATVVHIFSVSRHIFLIYYLFRTLIVVDLFVTFFRSPCSSLQGMFDSAVEYDEDYDDANHSEIEWTEERRRIHKRFRDKRPAFVLEVH